MLRSICKECRNVLTQSVEQIGKERPTQKEKHVVRTLLNNPLLFEMSKEGARYDGRDAESSEVVQQHTGHIVV